MFTIQGWCRKLCGCMRHHFLGEWLAMKLNKVSGFGVTVIKIPMGYIIEHIILLLNHCKDPYEPTSIMESKSLFCFCGSSTFPAFPWLFCSLLRLCWALLYFWSRHLAPLKPVPGAIFFVESDDSNHHHPSTFGVGYLDVPGSLYMVSKWVIIYLQKAH